MDIQFFILLLERVGKSDQEKKQFVDEYTNALEKITLSVLLEFAKKEDKGRALELEKEIIDLFENYTDKVLSNNLEQIVDKIVSEFGDLVKTKQEAIKDQVEQRINQIDSLYFKQILSELPPQQRSQVKREILDALEIPTK